VVVGTTPTVVYPTRSVLPFRVVALPPPPHGTHRVGTGDGRPWTRRYPRWRHLGGE